TSSARTARLAGWRRRLGQFRSAGRTSRVADRRPGRRALNMSDTRLPTRLPCGSRVLDLSRPHVMGILNVTPDSFSDGGSYTQRDKALRHAAAMVEAGATLIDVGGESTRPGARSVSPNEELERVAPVVETIARELDVVISVDTSTPAVMRECGRSEEHTSELQSREN